MPVRVLRSPVARFLAAGALVMAVVLLGTDHLVRQAAEREAIQDARVATELLGRTVAEPAVTPALMTASRIPAGTFHFMAERRLLAEGVVRIKLWRSDGVVIYSDQLDLVGQKFTLGVDARRVLAGRGAEARVFDFRRPENEYERTGDGLLEVYTRIEGPSGEPLLFEVYWSEQEMAANTHEVLAAFRPIAAGGLLAMLLLAAPLIWGLTRRVERSARAREALLRDAVEASDRERRTLARELHEGVLRELGDVSGGLGREMRASDLDPRAGHRIGELDGKLRRTMSAIRSMVLQVYPPDLHEHGLDRALHELTEPARAAGLAVELEVDEAVTAAREEAVALVWRAAQEGVRNALRHARARTLEVSVRAVAGRLTLRVVDDGVGFVPGAFDRGHRFGLRSLQDLAGEAGGRLVVHSRPGRGTLLMLETAPGTVPRPADRRLAVPSVVRR